MAKADLDLAMDVDECGGGVGGNSYELLVDDGFVYDQGFNSDDDHEEEDGEQVEGEADKKEEQPWLFLEESYEDQDDKDNEWGSFKYLARHYAPQKLSCLNCIWHLQ